MTVAAWLLALALAQAPPDAAPNGPGEPVAKEFSLERGRKFMDDVSLQWQRERKCVTCHTNFAYLTTGAPYAGGRAAYAAIRKFTEDLVRERWESKGPR